MKIAYFTDTYEPQINGVVTSIKLFVENLRKNGHEVYIFCPSCSKRDKFTYVFHSKKFKSYPEYRVGMPNIKLLKEIKKINPDVIHVHSPFTLGVAGLAIGRILNIPVIATYHTMLKEYKEYAGSTHFFKRGAIENYTKWFFNRASIISSPSRETKKMLKECGIKKRIEIFPTPSNLDIRNVKNKKPFILHVGRLCREKRIEIILKAFEKIYSKVNVKLIITSDGPDKKRLMNLCKELKIDKKVVFTGYLTKKELLKLYSTASLFVSASDTETQGLVVLEAMASGCLVIARNAQGFKDVVKNGKNGLLFNTEDELAEKMLFVLKNRKNRSIIKNAYKTVKQFSLENNNIEKLYYEALRNNKPSKVYYKLLYASYLFFSALEFWFIRNLNLTINSRFLDLHLLLFNEAFFFERLRKI